MAKKLIWSKQALQDRKDILDYWINRNKSKTYSIRLNNLFIDAIKIIAEHPNIGIATDFDNVKGKLVKDYYIFYEENQDSIHILAIWDCRQSPDKIHKKVK
ncbi:MAG: type II toxin-antitoxin system RelE/ParE family toxin [Bacteroidota bacterium]